MPFRVVISHDADRDLEDIYRYVSAHDSAPNAERLISNLVDACGSMANFPERGNVPKEMAQRAALGYREVHRGPYRIIYRGAGRTVFVNCVLDGRRDMQALLPRRLLS